MQRIINLALSGSKNRTMLIDLYWKASNTPKPIVIFAHGFKGFKDWGHFDQVASEFARSGFVFLKFNFSHNGTTQASPTSFDDLDAFGNNTFSMELDDLGKVIDFTRSKTFPVPADECHASQLFLLGHSRGGGIAILKAAEDPRVRKIATWAAVSGFGKLWSDEVIEEWRRNGVLYIQNTRTGQQMPLYWQLYADYLQHPERLDITVRSLDLQIPFLIVHGTADVTVPYHSALEMSEKNPLARLVTILGGDHTFSARHPWPEAYLPEDTQRALQATAAFFKE